MPRLASAVLPLCSQHPGQCGLFPLEKSLDAFAARYRLAEMAEHTLDVQYYIWQDDMSGRLLFSALLAAAKRGVRVRLLLDDNNTPGLDDILRLLDSHPRIEVRLFNPFSFRLLRPLGYITDFSLILKPCLPRRLVAVPSQQHWHLSLIYSTSAMAVAMPGCTKPSR